MTTVNLPDERAPVDRLFDRLAATYGAAWVRSLGAAPIGEIKSVWDYQLSGFFQNRRAMMAVAWALDNLPDRPPNAVEFKNLCRHAPAIEQPALPAPPADPARVAAELAKMAPLRVPAAPAACDSKSWARRIIERVRGGEVVSTYSIHAACSALGLSHPLEVR